MSVHSVWLDGAAVSALMASIDATDATVGFAPDAAARIAARMRELRSQPTREGRVTALVEAHRALFARPGCDGAVADVERVGRLVRALLLPFDGREREAAVRMAGASLVALASTPRVIDALRERPKLARIEASTTLYAFTARLRRAPTVVELSALTTLLASSDPASAASAHPIAHAVLRTLRARGLRAERLALAAGLCEATTS